MGHGSARVADHAHPRRRLLCVPWHAARRADLPPRGTRSRDSASLRAIFRRAMPGAVLDKPVSLAEGGFHGELREPLDIAERAADAGHPPARRLRGEVCRPVPLVRMLAARGYSTLRLAYFGGARAAADACAYPAEVLRAGADVVTRPAASRSQPHRQVLGVSRGSEAAQLLGAYYPSLVSAVVASVPSGTCLSVDIPDCSLPAWTLNGTAAAIHARSSIIRIRAMTRRLLSQTSASADRTSPFAAAAIWSGSPARMHARSWVGCWRRTAIPIAMSPTPTRARGTGVGALSALLAGRSTRVLYLNPADERAREAVWPRLLSFLARL